MKQNNTPGPSIPQRRAAVVYHKADFDGICSYAIARTSLESKGYEVTPLPWNHGEDTPDTDGYEKVVIADCCLPAWKMLSLYEEDTLIWIDHHATSIDLSESEGFCAAHGLRSIHKAACALCWDYFCEGKPAPKEVLMLAAYDIYDKAAFPWEEQTLPFQFGMRNRYGLDAEAFLRDFRHGTIPHDLFYEGKIIIKHLLATGEQAVRNSGFEILLAGKIKALCLLTTTCFSLPYEQSAREMGCKAIVCVSTMHGDGFKISAYAVDGDSEVNLGEYMKWNYQGGGHRNAAGCRLSENQFLQLLHSKTL